MNRRELFGCCAAAAVLTGCRRERVETPHHKLHNPSPSEGFLATVRGECHPLDRRAGAVLVAPSRDLQQALLAHFDVPDTTVYIIEMMCDASRRLASAESAAGRLGDAAAAWQAHGDRMRRLHDDLQASMGTGEVTRIHVHLAAYDVALGEARQARAGQGHAREVADARSLAGSIMFGLRQRMEADEPLFPRFVEMLCMASWRVLESEMASSADDGTRAHSAAAHVRRLLWLGDDLLGHILDVDLGPQLSVAAYHLRVAEELANVSGVPDATFPKPKKQPELLGASKAEACERGLAEWTRLLEHDEPLTPAFARDGCRWSAQLAFAEAADHAGDGDALRRHVAWLTDTLITLEKRGSTAERGDAAQKAVVRQAIAEAQAAGMNQPK